MAVSATGLFDLDADQCIQQALAMVSKRQDSGYDVRLARQALQMLLQIFALRRINLWTVELQTKALPLNGAVIEFDEQTTDVLEVTIRNTSATQPTDSPLTRIPRDQYHYLPNKTVPGRPIQFYLDRQRDKPRMLLYPIADKASYQVDAYTIRTSRDINSLTESVDVPNRWTPVVVHGLAWQLSLLDGEVGEDKIARLRMDFDNILDIALEEDRDRSPMRVGLDLSRYRV